MPVKQKYTYAVIATDIIIFTVLDQELKVLLIKMKKKPFEHHWAAPGGLVRPDESVDDSAIRNLAYTTGVKDVYLEQLYTFGKVDRDPFGRVVSVAYFALIPNADLVLKTTRDYAGVMWFDTKNLPKLAYDHKQIIEYAVLRLRSKLEYTNIIYSLLPERFTLTELQTMYEIILDRKIDKRNFRKKILAARIVAETGLTQQGKANRPAALYEFIDRNYRMIQML